MKKPLKMAWIGPTRLVGQGLRVSPGWESSVNQVDGDSDMVPTYQLSGGSAQKENNRLSQQFCLGENCPSSFCPDTRQLISSSFVLDAPVLELSGNESSKSINA